jgi:CRP-like cAMP-binding protein
MSRRINHSLTYTYKKSILNLQSTLTNILQNNNPNIRASRRKSTMKFPKNINPLSLIDINKKESKLNNILKIISKKYKDRTDDDNETIYSYFLQIDIEEKFINDLLQINISPSKLFNYMKPYIKGIKYSFKDNIYTISDKAEYTYIILKGKVNLYEINIKVCKSNAEEYYLYLYNCFLEAKKISDKNIKEIGDEFVDNYIISHIIEENQNIFPIFSYQDLDKLKEIIFKVKIFLDISENKGMNLELLYDKYNFPKNLYNYEEYKKGKIKLFKFENMLHETFSDSEKFYTKIMSDVFHICKKIKYVCKSHLKEGDIFGNYEIINSKPKREETSKVISKNCLILSINKKEYSNKIFVEEKTDLDYEIDDIHSNFFFRSLDNDFFYKNIFSKFKISNLLQKNILFNENTQLNNIYIIKEGLIDVHIQNISLLDLRILISNLYSKIKDKIKIDFNFDNDLNIPLKKLKSILNEKYSFNLFTCEKVIFGDI